MAALLMKPASRSFDRLARCYRALEYLAFGRDLERARYSLLPSLRNCRRILILGEGDGRCLEKLVAIAPAAQIDCLDSSATMLARAKKRLGQTPHHVNFIQADSLATELPAKHYDAVITCFFLDCFTSKQAAEIISKMRGALLPDALWLWADFVLPPGGFARIRAKIWLTILYSFFRWQTGLPTRKLPESEALIQQHGFRTLDHASFQWGLVQSAVYQITET